MNSSSDTAQHKEQRWFCALKDLVSVQGSKKTCSHELSCESLVLVQACCWVHDESIANGMHVGNYSLLVLQVFV